MAVPRKPYRWSGIAAALGAAAVLGMSAGAARARADPLDDLLEKLKDKGVLSEDEYQALKKAREEELLEQRAERRRQAQKAAQDAEEKKEKEAAAKQTKFDVSPGIRSIQLFGDVRLRYESRAGDSDVSDRRVPAAPTAETAGPLALCCCASASAAISRTIGSTGCAWTPAPTRARPG